MEGAKNADALLPAETAARLLRVFCFLRQHERKAKAARKMAELQAWTRAQTASPTTELGDSLNEPAASNQDAQALGEELDRMCAEAAGRISSRSRRSSSASADSALQTGPQPKQQQPDAKALHRELRELQRGVVLSSADTSGLITAGDLASALRALDRPTTKVLAGCRSVRVWHSCCS